MLSRSLDAFMDAGYVYVGMDHFALPSDALAVAKRQGRLHRNYHEVYYKSNKRNLL
jgi:oxygen-independent coproporphyrinogen-3 oxidase